jgi:putative selenate reductase molybdopterin-binding subunit
VHPVAHRGQIEGGFVYGLSQATLEELVVEQGQVVTASLGDYRIMSAADVPPLEVRILETEGDAFTGMRSVGELTNVGGAPALANAIHDAIGVRVRDLPITPERVRRAAQATADRAAAVATA